MEGIVVDLGSGLSHGLYVKCPSPDDRGLMLTTSLAGQRLPCAGSACSRDRAQALMVRIALHRVDIGVDGRRIGRIRIPQHPRWRRPRHIAVMVAGMMSADVLRAFAIGHLRRNIADFRQELG